MAELWGDVDVVKGVSTYRYPPFVFDPSVLG